MLDLALALEWGAIAARHGHALTLPWRPALLAEALPMATYTAADGLCLELRGTVQGRTWRLGMLLPLADGGTGLAPASRSAAGEG